MDSDSYSSPMMGHHHHHHHHHHRHHHHRLDLFGGTKPWDKTEWTAQDDRLRGGSSISHLTITPIPGSFPHSGGSPGTIATFHGNLDSKTLGGAGFASQRTVGDDKRWDLSKYDGIGVVVLIPAKPESQLIRLDDDDGDKPTPAPAPIEEKIYTIILKDCVIRGEPDTGKEISWEWNFKPKLESSEIGQAGHKKKGPTQQHFIANWDDFKPFYRGKPVDEEKKLDSGKIKRFNVMIRSFFQDQKDGEFSVSLISISAIGRKNHHEKVDLGEDEAGNVCPTPLLVSSEKINSRYFDAYDTEIDGQEMVNEKEISGSSTHHIQTDDEGWFGWLCGLRQLF